MRCHLVRRPAILLAALCLALLPGTARSQMRAPLETSQSAEALAKQVADPIANLISVPLQNNMDFGNGPKNALQNALNVQPVIPGALVFRMTDGPVDTRDVRNWWSYTPGACWNRPEGPGSTLDGRDDHPVVHVAHEDAAAYAAWAGKALPTEAEWERAARGGLEGAEYAWGEELTPGGVHMANTWQGPFPWRNFAADGFAGTSPVGSFPPNGYGLSDVTGNVWEWTEDWYAARHAADPAKPCCAPANPRGAPVEGSYDPRQPTIRIPRKVVKGGSFLCAPSYCRRYRPAARQPQMVDSAMSHLGFRCLRRPTSQNRSVP